MNYYEKEERQVSRSEKIREAKSAFARNAGRNAGWGYGRDAYAGTGGIRELGQTKPVTSDTWGEQADFEGEKNHYGILRMVTAGVLFFVLILSFHFKLSYQGFDRAYVEQVLSEDGHFEGLVKQAAEAMKQVVPKK
ncbi:MAG: hypothetical protein K2N43_08780 [Lachnospiraceae bacterium]|nr:hypothetical protein [Lachnospiraceae bacterium]